MAFTCNSKDNRRKETHKQRELILSHIRKVGYEPDLLRKRIEGKQEQTAIHDILHPLLEGIWSDDQTLQLEATIVFRRLISNVGGGPIDQIIKAGVVPRFVHFLSMHDSPSLQWEAAWVLTNITAGTSEQTRYVVDHGAVPILVELLLSPTSDEVLQQAIWTLSNIVGDSADYKHLIDSPGALTTLLAHLKPDGNLSIVRTSTWALSNICRYASFELVRPALPNLADLIKLNDDEEVLSEACCVLKCLTQDGVDRIRAVIDAGICPRLVELLQHSSTAVLKPALTTVGNIVYGLDGAQSWLMVNNQVLPNIVGILTSNHGKDIKKEACWIISNITAGNSDDIQEVINANIVPVLVGLLRTAELGIKKEAAWAILNATAGIHTQIRDLVNGGCIKPLCDLIGHWDTEIVRVCFNALENILEAGRTAAVNPYVECINDVQGYEMIENLESHEDNELAEQAKRIRETFFQNQPPSNFGAKEARIPPDGFIFFSKRLKT